MLHHPENMFNVPKPELSPGVDHPIPYFIVEDDAFALGEHPMKPFPYTGLDDRGRVFNYGLSRARRYVEDAFGILSTRFRIFRKEIEMRPEGAQKVVLRAVVLHNMLRIKCGALHPPPPPNSIDHEDLGYLITPGTWRREDPICGMGPAMERNSSAYAKNIRERLADYCLTKEGEMAWQYSVPFQ